MASDLGIKIRDCFDDVKGKRAVYETIWLQDLRQYKGIYDPEVLAKFDKKRSKSFIRETRTKVRTIDARIMDLLFPANGEKNWDINPTPIPSVPAPIEQQLLEQVKAILKESGENREPTDEEFKLAVATYTTETCKKMSQEIDDQLSEIKYRGIIRDVMHSGHLYGTGWLKGPLVDQVIEPHWEMQQQQGTDPSTGQPTVTWTWVLTQKKINRPYGEFKPIWNVYPDISVTDIGMCRFICERHIMPRHKLLQLAARPDFNGEIIKQFINDNPDGKAEYSNFENELYNLKEESTVSRPKVKGAYELIEYWGYVSASDLMAFDVEHFVNDVGERVDDDFSANIWIIDNEVIKIALEPVTGITIPYYAYYFDKDETSIYGEGISSIMRDPQKLVNASIRAMIDNAAHCAGPQYEVNVDLLAEGEDPSDIGAFKVWLRTGRDADIAGKEVVRVKTLASYTPEFLNMVLLG